MSLEDITNVLCLSCVLIFFYVSSQSSCNRGWFGHQCKYKCRCDSDNCDVNGSCITPATCEAEWFGPACQYADLAYYTSNVTAVTDGNDVTCNDPAADDKISITLNDSIIFTWLRIHVNDQGSGALESLSVTFMSGSGGSVPCTVWRKHAVSKTILDMHCNLSMTIRAISLTGEAARNICSVYVSGGRNVAVNETASQGTTFQLSLGNATHDLDAYRAVDGDTTKEANSLSCSQTENSSTWTLTLSRPRSVHRYVIYNRGDGKEDKLIGFQLESFDSMNHSVHVYKDNTTSAASVYRFKHSPILVQMVVVTSNNSDNTVTLCEVEIYGDSVCDAQHYGRDCEHSCNCLNNEACFVTTGACPSGCLAGFSGDSCSDDCAVETFGMNCTESCSPNCAPSDQADVSSCDTKTGACIKGCKSGFYGTSCQDDSPKADAESAGYLMEIILGVCGLLVVLFLLFFCFRRKGKPPQAAAEKTAVNAQHEDPDSTRGTGV